MDRAHLSQDDLILFMDREMDAGRTAAAERHLRACVQCEKRLAALQAGSAAYGQYHEHILKPALEVPERGWAAIVERAEKAKKKHRPGWGFWWAAAAVACGLAVSVIYLQRPAPLNAPELLAKAEAAPESVPHALLFSSGGSQLRRPAEFQHVQALFVQANYSWEKPLSARSFAAWRRQLPRKEDLVTSLRENGGERYYRVRTRTPAGILHTASITLQAGNYHATQAAFEFQGEDALEVSEQAVETPAAQTVKAPLERPKLTETLASPEDELRVFAALNAVGADAGEPVDVKLEAGRHHVLVTGMGIPPERQKELEAALSALPRTITHFNASQPIGRTADLNTTADTYSGDTGSAFRQELQGRVGGARPWQAITDGALDASNTLVAQAHALQVLAQEFPAPVEAQWSGASRELLLRLRQRHLAATETAIRQLKDELKPLLSSSDPGDVQNPPGQADAVELFSAARNLDQLVSRLLAGSYTDLAGGEMLQQLPDAISKVELLARAQMVHDR